MPYELCPEEELPDALRRLAAEELEAAVARLNTAERDPVPAIHEARKRCKQARTVLRLARGGALTEVEYRRESLVIRNGARLIGAVRDVQVALQTADALRRHLEGRDPELERRLVELRARLEKRQETVVEAAHGEDGHVATAIDRIEVARSRIPGWPLRGKGFECIGPGLQKLYRQGKRRLDAAAGEPATERFHGLRKRVKDLWHTTKVLRPIWPGPLEAVGVEWHRLSDLLGDEHDLAAIEELAMAELDSGREVVVQAIDRRRSELRVEALDLAGRLLTESPSSFTARLEDRWKAWRDRSEATTAGEER